MFRRSVVMLAVLVVVLYFSIILFMLSPLHVKNSYYRHYPNNFVFRQSPRVKWCKELKWQTPPSCNVVALVSYPGSGNTWLRYLLQQVTGIMTGSIYMDYGLKLHGFPAENVTDGSVLVVKTHESPPKEPDKFKSAILLIRNPRDAILADFNRLHKGHIGTAPKSAFKSRSYSPNTKSDWISYVFTQLSVWENLHHSWLNKFLGPIHVVFYEVLVRDTRQTLLGILDFLNYTVTEEDMRCTEANQEGIYRRRRKHENFDPFSQDMYYAAAAARARIIAELALHRNTTHLRFQRPNHTDSRITDFSTTNSRYSYPRDVPKVSSV